MVTKIQNSTIDTQRKKEKNPFTINNRTTRKLKKKEKKRTKIIQNNPQITNRITMLSILALNLNRINNQIKWHRVAEWI